jgi:3-hydroxyisobutyrate dehydrogenase-like beta-hydroxyacid dehydrogenase
MSDYQVGFIGIGNMGWQMAKNLLKAGHNILKAGHKLAVLDLDKARVAKFIAEEPNAVAADGAVALAKASNVIITMLPTGPIVRDVVQGMLDAGALKSGTIVIDMSSSEPVGTKQLSDTLSTAGVALVDSPVSGGVPGAQAGTLTLMVGGDDAAAIERAWPVLQTMGAKLFRTGASGSGDTMKALNNFIAAANFRAVSEALAMGIKFGSIPPDHRHSQCLNRAQLHLRGRVQDPGAERQVCGRFCARTADQGREDRVRSRRRTWCHGADVFGGLQRVRACPRGHGLRRRFHQCTQILDRWRHGRD